MRCRAFFHFSIRRQGMKSAQPACCHPQKDDSGPDETNMPPPRLQASGAATYVQKLLHPTLEAAAAAYWFHLVQNHPFVDGNKRAGLISCLAFLLKNGRTLDISSQNLVEITLKIARGNLKKPEIEEIIRQNIMPLQRPLI